MLGERRAPTGFVEEFPKQARGRLRKTPASYLKAVFWYHTVCCLAGKRWRSPYGMEKYFSSKAKRATTKQHRLRGDRVWVPTNKARKHRTGVVPNPAHVREVDKEFPGTGQLLEMPHWRILDFPPPSLKELHELFRGLRPSIVKILFRQDEAGVWQRKPNIPRQLKALNRESDFDALVACLGIMREWEYSGSRWEFDHYDAARTARQIFLRLVACSPFRYMAGQFFNHLRKYFFTRKYICGWSLNLDEIAETLADRMNFRNAIILMAEDLCLIRAAELDQLGCLYVAETLGLGNVYSTFHRLLRSDSEVKKDLLAKRFVRRLRRWTPRTTAFPLLSR